MADAVLSPSAVYASLRWAKTETALRSGVVSVPSLARSASLDPSLGGTYADQLASKAAAARQVLEQYTTIGAYDAAATEAAIAAVSAWKESHQSLWSRIQQKLVGVTDTVSPDEALQMPADMVRAYAEALYLTAQYALHMYANGVFARQVEAGVLTAGLVQNDAEARLNMFDAVLTMEASGTLQAAYGSVSSRGTAGLGIEPLVVLAIAVVAAIAVLAGAVIYYRQTVANNALAEQACQQFLATGDPLLQGSCDAKESDPVVIAKYAIGVFALGGFLYLALPEIPRMVKGFRS